MILWQRYLKKISFLIVISSIFFILTGKIFAQKQATVIVSLSVCGDGEVDGFEVCDGTNFAGKSCSTYGYNRGNLLCLNNCMSISTENCWFEQVGRGAGAGPYAGGTFTPPAETRLIILGKAYPETEVSILKDGKIIARVPTDSQANFSFQTTDISPGVNSLSFSAQDKLGLKSILFTLTFNVMPNAITTVRGIYLPPTIGINKNVVRKGELLDIYGQTVPEVQVPVYVASPKEIVKETKSDKDGKWKIIFDTIVLEDESFHTAKSQFKAFFDGALVVSSFSRFVTFYVGKEPKGKICPGADLNQDGKVNLIDFSILLYYWGTNNSCADQNQDGIVNLTDFSIMMYYWTG